MTCSFSALTSDNVRVMAGPVRDERADALRARYDAAFGDAELPVPVEAIAEDLLGLQVGESEDLAVSGMLLPLERQIWLNASEGAPRRRFTLAHELGHWVCQHLEGRSAPVYCRAADVQPEPSAADRALEREANLFAAELLMPEEAVRRAFKDGADLADRFGVSDEAMAWRLFNFGLVEKSPV
jgi:Zn-dependent peptidase ImmA (M78 family)